MSSRSVSFSHIDSVASQRNQNFLPPSNIPLQEESLRLLQRLRQALHPLTDAQSQASKEYESLQDEILRLSQHMTQQKSRAITTPWEDEKPYLSPIEPGPDSLPYRTIKIVVDENRNIQRLDEAPMDLNQYRQIFQDGPASPRTLTLVGSDQTPAPVAPDLLIDNDGQLGHATANLTQQSLDARGPRSAQVSIRPEVALSLLDD